jgi:hypothetical protein
VLSARLPHRTGIDRLAEHGEGGDGVRFRLEGNDFLQVAPHTTAGRLGDVNNPEFPHRASRKG